MFPVRVVQHFVISAAVRHLGLGVVVISGGRFRLVAAAWLSLSTCLATSFAAAAWVPSERMISLALARAAAVALAVASPGGALEVTVTLLLLALDARAAAVELSFVDLSSCMI